MQKLPLIEYWEMIPIKKENAVSYSELTIIFGVRSRQVRRILHLLGTLETNDGLVLIRTSHGKGFYRTDDREEIKAYRNECLHRAEEITRLVKPLERVLLK